MKVSLERRLAWGLILGLVTVIWWSMTKRVDFVLSQLERQSEINLKVERRIATLESR